MRSTEARRLFLGVSDRGPGGWWVLDTVSFRKKLRGTAASTRTVTGHSNLKKKPAVDATIGKN
ncbi:MAG: hypothetical protein MUF44_03080 [Hydrogenophaga sp.]|jgi:hypothetical protein|nr:hypothetical protein [Hydrogenophaga sp.]